jgi:hypothetical protein
VHVVADTDHSENISEMFERYVKTAEDCELVLKGARESMAIDRAYRGASVITWNKSTNLVWCGLRIR